MENQTEQLELIRAVKQNAQTGMWAFLEFNANDPKQFIILGGMEFTTEQEARHFARGFANDSYEFKHPLMIYIEGLQLMCATLKTRLESVNKELENAWGNYYKSIANVKDDNHE